MSDDEVRASEPFDQMSETTEISLGKEITGVTVKTVYWRALKVKSRVGGPVTSSH